MSRKNNLLGFPWLSGPAALAAVSDVTQIQFLDNVGVQTDFTGTDISGSTAAQVSANFARDNQGNVTNPGTWVTLTGVTQAIAAGSPATTYMDLNQLSAPWIRLLWTPSTLLAQSIVAVADVAGSLNSKYFTISSTTVNYVVYISVDGGGIDPAVPDTTSVEVAIASDDSADVVATAVAAALNALTGVFTSSSSTDTVTVTTVVAGADTAAADVNTGFTFAIASTDTIASVITAKML